MGKRQIGPHGHMLIHIDYSTATEVNLKTSRSRDCLIQCLCDDVAGSQRPLHIHTSLLRIHGPKEIFIGFGFFKFAEQEFHSFHHTHGVQHAAKDPHLG